MDTRLIYEKAKHRNLKVDYDNADDSGWVSIGRLDSMDIELAQEIILNWFDENKIYFAINRQTAGEITKENAIDYIVKHESIEKVIFCDLDFRKFVEYDHIGVLRKGNYSS